MKHYYLVSNQGERVVGASENIFTEFGALCPVLVDGQREFITGALEGIQIYFSKGEGNQSSYLKVFKSKDGFFINATQFKKGHKSKTERLQNIKPERIKVLDWWLSFKSISDLDRLDNYPLKELVLAFIGYAKEHEIA